MFKISVLAAVLVVVKAVDYTHGPQVYQQYAPAPIAQHYAAPAPVYHQQAPVYKQVIEEPSTPPHYDYGYSVNDPHTGDNKMQQETRRGDVVHGMYSLIDADGTKRTVEYTADPHNGFNAVVHREPAQAHVKTVVSKVAAPVYASAPVQYAPAPVLKSYAAPVQYTAPVQYAPAPIVKSYAAPVQYTAPVQYAPAPAQVQYKAPAPVQYAPQPLLKTYQAPAQVREYPEVQAPIVRYTKTPGITYAQNPAPIAHGITYAKQQ